VNNDGPGATRTPARRPDRYEITARPGQPPHSLCDDREKALKVAIGRALRAFRTQKGMTGGQRRYRR